jgi:hypothetical protein
MDGNASSPDIWGIVIKAASLLVGIVSLSFTVANQVRRSRQALKIDLEIMNLLKDQAMRSMVESSVRSKIANLYGDTSDGQGRPRIQNMKLFVFGCVIFVGFTAWTIQLSWGDFNWKSILTGFFALGGIGNIVNAFDPRRLSSSARSKVGPSTKAGP